MAVAQGPPSTTQYFGQPVPAVQQPANGPAPTPAVYPNAAYGPQQPQPNVGDTGRGINGVVMPTIAPTAMPTSLGAAAPQVAAPDPYAEPDFMTPQMTQYVNQFKASQAAQQQALNSSLAQAISGLGERRDAAAKIVASMPGQYNTIMNEANADQKASLAANPKTPVDPGAAGTIGANNTLINNANAQIGVAGKEGQPLLNAAVAADYSKGRTTLSNTDMANQMQLQQQQAAFNQQQLLAQEQAHNEWARMTAGFKHDTDMANLSKTNSPDSLDNREKFLQWEQDHGMLPKSQDPLGAAADASAIKAGFQGGNAELQTTLASQPYQFAISALTGSDNYTKSGESGKGIPDKGSIPDVVRFFQNQPDVLRALQYSGMLTLGQDGNWTNGPNFPKK